MRVIVQRVNFASVKINDLIYAEIQKGFLILIGIESNDSCSDAEWIVKKTCSLRIFPDFEGKMNFNINQVNGDILLVSQFTLHAQTKKGNRPSFIKAANPEIAVPLYEKVIELFNLELRKEIFIGKFGSNMKIILENDGPLTIFIDSKNKE
jgi:D-tyrosyl-tRNA(Tyr) deacylase